MKLVLLCISSIAFPLLAADVSGVHSVYVFTMAHGMDQYLANQLTSQHAVQVVTDPQRADAILTDHLGDAFEDQLDDLYPPPEPAKPAAKPGKDAPKPADKSKDAGQDSNAPPPIGADPVNKLPTAGAMSTFGRGKGTIFLVDVKSRQVIWSTYQRPKDVTSRQLDHTAQRIVEHLKQDIAKTQQ